MRFKALRTKREPKEFITVDSDNILYTHALPNPMPMTATMEKLKEYFEKYNPLPPEINFDNFELIEFELTEVTKDPYAEIYNTVQQYHLNCEKCGKPFWCNQRFPNPQICPSCYF
jgi:hypothetical protein